MGEEKTQVISFRVSEETYRKLKEYADAYGESVTAAPSPRPSPGPVTPPTPEAPEIPADILELPKRFNELFAR